MCVCLSAAEYKTCSTDCAEETCLQIQCEGNLLKMDSAVPNGCSNVCDVATDLCQQAVLFMKLFDKKEARMRDLLSEILQTGIHVRKWNTKSKWSIYTGLVSAAVTVGAGVAIPFAGGIGFAITAALTSVCAAGAVFGFKIKQFRTEEESLKRIKQFLKIVNRLEHELEEVMRLCKKFQRGAEKDETQNVTSLKNNLVKVFESNEKLRAADGVKELTARCQTVFSEFEKMRKQLEEFRGGTESAGLPENPALDSADEKLVTDAGNTETELENSSESSSLIPQKDDKVVKQPED